MVPENQPKEMQPVSILAFVKDYFDLAEAHGRQKFGITELSRRGVQDLRELRVGYLMPGKEDLMGKLRLRIGIDADKYRQKVAELIETTDLNISFDPQDPEPIGLESEEMHEEGAKRFWALQYIKAIIFVGLAAGPWFSPLLKDIFLIEQLSGITQGRDEADIRGEEKEELRRQLSRSLVDVRACIAWLERGGPGQFA